MLRLPCRNEGTIGRYLGYCCNCLNPFPRTRDSYDAMYNLVIVITLNPTKPRNVMTL